MTAPQADEMMDPGGPYADLTKAEYFRRIHAPGTKEFNEYAPPGYVFHRGEWVLDTPVVQAEIAADSGTPGAPAAPDAAGGEPSITEANTPQTPPPSVSPVVSVELRTRNAVAIQDTTTGVDHEKVPPTADIGLVVLTHADGGVSIIRRAVDYAEHEWEELVHALLHTLHPA